MRIIKKLHLCAGVLRVPGPGQAHDSDLELERRSHTAGVMVTPGAQASSMIGKVVCRYWKSLRLYITEPARDRRGTFRASLSHSDDHDPGPGLIGREL
jgi:hypothetical protein